MLVYPAERMNAISANALLKTLEEPAGDLRFVLATEAGHLLLPTIRSRCISHAMLWPQADTASTWLQQCGVPAEDTEFLLRMAGGRPSDALGLAAAGIGTQDWSAWPRALAQGEPGWIKDAAAPQAIEGLQKLCHDLMATHCGAPPRYFSAADLSGLFSSNPSGPGGRGRPMPDLGALVRWSKDLMALARKAEHPFQAGLMTEFLVAEAAQAINSGFRSKTGA